MATSAESARVNLDGFQQADVLKTERIPLLGPEGEVHWHPTPQGVVLISQTCDIVQPTKAYLQVAPVVRLQPQQVKPAAKGAMPRYVAVPAVGVDAFADLDHVATVSKEHVALLVPERGVETTQDLRRFGMRVGRRFARFGFPDEVAYWLNPLKDQVVSKAGNVSSPLGRVLDEMVESLRLECDPGWESGAPYQLKLLVLVKAGLLPALDEGEIPSVPLALSQWLYDEGGKIMRKPAQVAERILGMSDSVDRYERQWLWEAFAESLAAVCRPKASAPPEAHDAVVDGEIGAEVATVQEVSYERILRSEEIDVEHLSPPLPR
ncbi:MULTISPECIES: hypothetical protein [Streptomycetaceae]|uniref:hypothetical protein n=1 Tax=Streptomycetaceae TaxID=2062 RepID=UPI0012FFB16C|nr:MULTISPECIES: hypothetical protein [Streptomycetaceae]MYS60813.1 hypothetical protein [Streptomyces sp. SID5468]